MTAKQGENLWFESFSSLERGVLRLVNDAQVTAAMVVRGDGQLIAWAGATGGAEPSSLGALAAGCMAAGAALLDRVAGGGRPSQSIDGEASSLFLQSIDPGTFLLVLFDRRCSLGLVRLRARRLIDEARPWLDGLKQHQGAGLGDIDDDDIDALFA